MAGAGGQRRQVAEHPGDPVARPGREVDDGRDRLGGHRHLCTVRVGPLLGGGGDRLDHLLERGLVASPGVQPGAYLVGDAVGRSWVDGDAAEGSQGTRLLGLGASGEHGLGERQHRVAAVGELGRTRVVVFAQMPVAEETKTVVFAPSVEHPELTSRSQWTARAALNSIDNALVMADFVGKTLGYKRMVIIHEDQEGVTTQLKPFTEKYTQELGGQIVGQEAYKQGDTDFRNHIAKLRGLNAEFLWVIGANSVDKPRVIKQVRESGWNIAVGTQAPLIWRFCGGWLCARRRGLHDLDLHA